MEAFASIRRSGDQGFDQPLDGTSDLREMISDAPRA
jgi:hypothetical protein